MGSLNGKSWNNNKGIEKYIAKIEKELWNNYVVRIIEICTGFINIKENAKQK